MERCRTMDCESLVLSHDLDCNIIYLNIALTLMTYIYMFKILRQTIVEQSEVEIFTK